MQKYDNRYGDDPANLALHGIDGLLAGFTRILAGCKVLLRPGGTVVVTARPWRQRGELVDLPGAILTAGANAGLIPAERCVALLAGLRGQRLIPRPSFFQLDNIRKARARGEPLAQELKGSADRGLLRSRRSEPAGQGLWRPRRAELTRLGGIWEISLSAGGRPSGWWSWPGRVNPARRAARSGACRTGTLTWYLCTVRGYTG